MNHTKTAEIPKNVLKPVKSTEPANYLIVGSDSRGFVKDPIAEEHFGSPKYQTGQRSDTIMIAHVDPKSPGQRLPRVDPARSVGADPRARHPADQRRVQLRAGAR